MSSILRPYHLSTCVRDLDEARAFYTGVLGRPELRATATSIHIDMWGSQLTLHRVPGYNAKNYHREVDAETVPVPHYGAALTVEQFHDAARRLIRAEYEFVLEPHVRFVEKPHEQWVMFVLDPSGNALEIKAFTKIPTGTWV